MKDFMYMRTLGMTERDDFYSKMIREGQMTREEALERLRLENGLYVEHIKQLLDDVGMQPCDIESS